MRLEKTGFSRENPHILFFSLVFPLIFAVAIELHLEKKNLFIIMYIFKHVFHVKTRKCAPQQHRPGIQV